MNIQFRADILTTVPTCSLVENYQDLCEAIAKNDWDMVQTVKDCISDSIQDHTTVPPGLNIKPSGSSLIAMGCTSGIIVDGDGNDIKCAAGRPISYALDCGCCQCPDNCPHNDVCNPEQITLVLQGGYVFDVSKVPALDGEEGMVKFLDNHYEPLAIARMVKDARASSRKSSVKNYRKLVRDEIPAIIAASGETPATQTIKADKLLSCLLDKLKEETTEVVSTPSLEELADVMEVLHALAGVMGYNENELASARKLKREARGGFDKAIFLVSTVTADDTVPEELRRSLAEILSKEDIFKYKLLSRMQMDCEYALGNGQLCGNHFWGGSVEAQIYCMKGIWDSFPSDGKPQWLTMEQIEDYEAALRNIPRDA